MKIEIPEFCLIALVGASASGKTTFAKKHFKPTEVMSSDFFRGLVSDDENYQGATDDAFDSLFYVVNKRLKNMKLTVIDATNIQSSSRRKILDVAKKNDCQTVAIVLNPPEAILQERNRNRTDRTLSERVIIRHKIDVKSSIKNLKKEGFRFIYVLNDLEQIENTEIIREKLWNNKKI